MTYLLVDVFLILLIIGFVPWVVSDVHWYMIHRLVLLIVLLVYLPNGRSMLDSPGLMVAQHTRSKRSASSSIKVTTSFLFHAKTMSLSVCIFSLSLSLSLFLSLSLSLSLFPFLSLSLSFSLSHSLFPALIHYSWPPSPSPLSFPLAGSLPLVVLRSVCLHWVWRRVAVQCHSAAELQTRTVHNLKHHAFEYCVESIIVTSVRWLKIIEAASRKKSDLLVVLN